MKKIASLLVLLASCILLNAQVPQGFNYQAVAHYISGAPVSNSAIPVKIGILSDTITPVIVWEELHSTVKTDMNGVFNLVIGTGSRQTGSALTFSEIDWITKPLFLRIQLNFQGTWKIMGNAKLWSVPYAMIAGDLGGPVKKLAVKGNTDVPDEALFEVKNKIGQSVFAVYNEGVRIYVDDGAKGAKGGFAVGGFGTDKAGESQKYLVVTKDSTRIYTDDNAKVKKAKGGFAVGGFETAKSVVIRDYLVVSKDSTRIYINNNPLLKKAKGGFAVGGYDQAKGSVTSFTSLTPDNYFIGHESGSKITTGKYNSFLGYQAGKENMDGNNNIFIGYQSGLSNLGPTGAVGGSEGSYNCFVGYQAGYSNINGANNTLIGYSSGKMSISDHNTFLGSESGLNNTTGYSNTFIGTSAGMMNQTGGYNVFLGRGAGRNVKNGNWNTYIGTASGANIGYGEKNVIIGSEAMGLSFYAGPGTGSSNIVIGYQAGYNAFNGSSNIFIGNQAGYNETGSDKLIIENSLSDTPLIYGNFSSKIYRVNGNIEATGTIASVSDSALKQNIEVLKNVSEKLGLIRGISFDWNLSGHTGLLLREGRQIGLIAQEVERVYPELVSVNDKGYKMVDYTKFTPVLLEAIKEQQTRIEQQQRQIDELKELVSSLISGQSSKSE